MYDSEILKRAGLSLSPVGLVPQMKVDILAFQEWGKLIMIMNVMYGKCDVPLALQPES